MSVDITLISIDPGVCTGIAWWHIGGLYGAGACTVDDVHLVEPYGLYYREDMSVVCELPQVYRNAQSKGDPNDLIKVAVEVGQWKERALRYGCPWTEVKPAYWKGQVPKPVHHARILRTLNERERAYVEGIKLPASKMHNVMDAIGLGLWKLGRLA